MQENANLQHLDQQGEYYHSTDEDILHRSGYGIHLLVWFTLVSLTGVTVAVAGLDLESFLLSTYIAGVSVGEIITITVALSIAAIKSFLVMWYFMHIKYEPLFLRMFLAICFITFMIFIVLTFFDVGFRGQV